MSPRVGDRPTPGTASRVDVAAHLLAAVWVLAALVVTIWRPLAPPLTELPPATRWFDPAHLAEVAAYQRPLQWAGLFGLVVRLVLPVLVAFTPAGRRLVERVVEWVGAQRGGLAATVVVVGVLIASDVAMAPLAFWAGYVHEGAYGFRTQGLGGWAYDWFAVRAPSWVAAALLVLAGYALARRLPRVWPPIAGLLGAVLVALVVFAGPYLLEPLLLRTAPLEPGPIREEIEDLLDDAGVPADRILVADASRRTTRANAYVSGLGATRRVVLYDNLVEQSTPAEVAMVVAHEVGHHRNADLPRGVALGGAGTVLMAYVLSAVARARVRRGAQEAVTDPRGAAVLLAVVVALNTVSMPVQSALSRRAEAAADLAALELTQDPGTYIDKTLELARSSLSDPDPPWWAYALWYSHPTAVARLTMGERWPFDAGEGGPGS